MKVLHTHFSAMSCVKLNELGGAVAQLGARLDGIEEVVGSNPIGSTNCKIFRLPQYARDATLRRLYKSHC
jgi:hypothetical protein